MSKSYNLVVPLSGLGQRMINGGFNMPKPMLICGDKTILEWSMSSIDTSDCNVVFIVNPKHVREWSIDSWLKQLYPDSKVVALEDSFESAGAYHTVLEGTKRLIDYNDSLPLIVYCPDTVFYPWFEPKPEHFRVGHILTFKANSKNYSYVRRDDSNNIIEVAEKQVISNDASVGVYCFKNTQFFSMYAGNYLAECKEAAKEAHICPIYNYLIEYCFHESYVDNKTRERVTNHIKRSEVEKIHVMGTPEEFKFFEEVSFKYLVDNRRFFICSDHSGFAVKQDIITRANKFGMDIVDIGCFSTKDCDYNEYVKATAGYVLKNKNAFGIGVCRSGQGINICANKIEGIRSLLA